MSFFGKEDEYVEDPASRLEELAESFYASFKLRFLEVVALIRDEKTLEELVALLEAGLQGQALVRAELIAARIGAKFGEVMIVAGNETAEFLQSKLKVIIGFDQVNTRAVAAMQANNLRLVRDFTADMRGAVTEALVNGIRRGLNPIEIARMFKASIGLNQYQVRAIENFRRLLEESSRDVLTRALRDRRFDPTILNSIRSGVPLSQARINQMVERYAQRQLQYRAEVIARTEALRAVSEGAEEMYHQAIEAGEIDADDIIRTWVSARDARVRDSHKPMNGQKRKFGELFLSGLGNLLRFPRDPNVAAEDVNECRCALSVRLKKREAVPE